MKALYKTATGKIICVLPDDHVFSDMELERQATGVWARAAVPPARLEDARRKRCMVENGQLAENLPENEWPENQAEAPEGGE